MRYIQWIINWLVLAWWSTECQYWGIRYQVIKQYRKIKDRFKKKSVVKTIYVDVGVGQQFETVAQFNSWLSQRDLIGNDENIVARIHSDQKVEHDFLPFNSKGLIILKPAPAMGYDER